MIVLITNCTLSSRTGTETYVRDLALGLLDKGHTPVVYAPDTGPIALELRNLTIPVVDDLNNISTNVDVIHGHHRHETMTALLHFPGVPAVFFVHDWHAWQDLPLIFPRILRYVAVDKTRLDRLVIENGIPEDKVTILQNGVDTRRFRPRRALPKAPKRAAVFSSYVRSRRDLVDLRAACQQCGLSLDVIGSGMKRLVSEPENILRNYDLVFAIGRSALEAMAIGTGVIIWGVEGLGGFVDSHNFTRFQDSNFGRRALRPAGVADLIDEINRFNRDEAQAVQQNVRANLNQSYLVDQHIALYHQVINESQVVVHDPHSEMKMASYYLKYCLPVLKHNARLTKYAPRQRHQLLDVIWITLTLFVIAFTVRVYMLAMSDRAYGVVIASISFCILLAYLLLQLRMFVRGKLVL